MKRSSVIALGIVTIIFAYISAGIGFWLLAYMRETYTFAIRFVLGFFLMATPMFTMSFVIYLLKKDQ